MKNIFKLVFPLTLLLAITSCKKAENKIFFEGGTAPSLSASATAVDLEPGFEGLTALAFSWTNPDYKFTTGLSSQDVSYRIEMDTLGGNFSSGIKYSTVIANDLSKVYTIGELNGILGNDMQLQLNPRRVYTIQLRVISSIGSAVKLTSNTIEFTTKPFAPPPKVTLPPFDHLYLVGDATSGGWNNPVPLPDQEFTRMSSTLYELVAPLGAGKHFLFLPLNGDWGNKYACHDGSVQAPDGGEFGYNGGNPFYNSDIPGPLKAGTYKITVNFQLGKYTVVKQ